MKLKEKIMKLWNTKEIVERRSEIYPFRMWFGVSWLLVMVLSVVAFPFLESTTNLFLNLMIVSYLVIVMMFGFLAIIALSKSATVLEKKTTKSIDEL